jgi:hypothetical protein
MIPAMIESEQARVMRRYAEPPTGDPIWEAWRQEAKLRTERERADARRDERQIPLPIVQDR